MVTCKSDLIKVSAFIRELELVLKASARIESNNELVVDLPTLEWPLVKVNAAQEQNIAKLKH